VGLIHHVAGGEKEAQEHVLELGEVQPAHQEGHGGVGARGQEEGVSPEDGAGTDATRHSYAGSGGAGCA
jgi:hypothetical protein